MYFMEHFWVMKMNLIFDGVFVKWSWFLHTDKVQKKRIFSQKGNFAREFKRENSSFWVINIQKVNCRWYRGERILNQTCLRKSCGLANRRLEEFLNETRHLLKQNRRMKKRKLKLVEVREIKKKKVNVTKFNQHVREGYYEMQYWNTRKAKLFILNKGKLFRKTVKKKFLKNITTRWVYSNLRRRIKKDFRLRNSVNWNKFKDTVF